MEKHIMGENGISYTLGEDGRYCQVIVGNFLFDLSFC